MDPPTLHQQNVNAKTYQIHLWTFWMWIGYGCGSVDCSSSPTFSLSDMIVWRMPRSSLLGYVNCEQLWVGGMLIFDGRRLNIGITHTKIIFTCIYYIYFGVWCNIMHLKKLALQCQPCISMSNQSAPSIEIWTSWWFWENVRRDNLGQGNVTHIACGNV